MPTEKDIEKAEQDMKVFVERMYTLNLHLITNNYFNNIRTKLQLWAATLGWLFGMLYFYAHIISLVDIPYTFTTFDYFYYYFFPLVMFLVAIFNISLISDVSNIKFLGRNFLQTNINIDNYEPYLEEGFGNLHIISVEEKNCWLMYFLTKKSTLSCVINSILLSTIRQLGSNSPN